MRHRTVLALALVIAAACGARSPGARTASTASSTGPRVEEVSLTVADLDASTRFFVDVLGATELARTRAEVLGPLFGIEDARADVARVRLGAEIVALRRIEGRPPRAIDPSAESGDLDFQHLAIVVRDIDDAWRRVLAAGVRPVSPEPQRIPDSNPAAGGIRAAYFRDREGHPLELIWYPAGRGDPRWQAASGPLVLGVDHTAIASSSSEASLRFYRDLLGLHVAGASFNEGVEQERLSGVSGARVRITGLRGEAGPGVELLEYVAPGPGRARALDAGAIDLAHTETAIAVADLDAIVARLREAGVSFLTPSPVPCPVCATDARAAIVRDPDGHAVRVQGR